MLAYTENKTSLIKALSDYKYVKALQFNLYLV